jgi:prepilin-type N-terminal cleavage/methylation domain-containing protein
MIFSAPPQPRRRRRGLSLAELLVVLAIIALVTVVAIPTVTGHMERARIASAQADCRAFAQAEEACAAIHGFYVPLQVLDDLPGSSVLNNDADRIGLESGILLIDPLIPPLQQQGNQLSIGSTGTARAFELTQNWQGPFTEARRATNSPNPGNQTDQRRDYPLDPYGQPYKFFSPIGVIGSGAAAERIEFPEDLPFSFSDGLLTTNRDEFERYTIMSTGRDTLIDNQLTLQQGDDIVYFFGVVGFETGSLVRFPF